MPSALPRKIQNLFCLAKSGSSLVPLYYISIYLVFVGLDIYTTWLGTPDLKYERNWIIRLFNLSFREIIPLAFLFAITLSYLSLHSANRIYRELKQIKSNGNSNTISFLKSDRKIVLNTIILIMFYSHLIISIFVTLNNYLNYIYLYKIENPFSPLAYSYVKFESFFNQNFYLYSSGFLIMAGSLLVYFKISRLIKSQ
jgi:hypothetical protein